MENAIVRNGRNRLRCLVFKQLPEENSKDAHHFLINFLSKIDITVASISVILALVGFSAHKNIGSVNSDTTFQKVLTPIIPSKLQKLSETFAFGFRLLFKFTGNCASLPLTWLPESWLESQASAGLKFQRAPHSLKESRVS